MNAEKSDQNTLEKDATGTNDDESFDKLSSILSSLGKTNLLKTFIEEGVDDQLLMNLNLEDKMDWDPISLLIPQVGLRIKFRHAVSVLQVRIFITKY